MSMTVDSPVVAAFQVDAERRTIRGLAVPYGHVARSAGRRWRFTKGTLTYADPSRVKVLIGHDFNRAVGVVTAFEDTPEGLYFTARIASGAAGDEALSMAAEGVWDGLSIGLGEEVRGTTRAGVIDVQTAPLREISLTPVPSFDAARVTSVAASAAEERTPTTMPEITEETPETGEALPGTATFSDLTQAVTTAVTDGLAAGFAAAPEGREVVRAGAAFTVDEPAPYRFDGTGGGAHEFSTDLFAAARGDSEARQRVTEFVGEAIQPATFAVASGDVADLNPATNRQDMYVDRLVQSTPLWLALRKGSLTDNTPFIFPKFGSAEGLVDDHVEMVEPEPGSFTATKQTVTPGAMSGKVEIPREIVDAGGNPQVSALIWREMERAYYAKIEGKVAALLAASNPTVIALTAGAEDAALVDQLEDEYAALQFLDGGFRFDYAPTHQGLFRRLAAASDDTGRKLLPMIGPTNTNGGATSRFGSLNVAGVTHLPVPTLGAPGVGVKRSYLIASEDVHAWASPPRELRFEWQVAHVDLGVWGYAATAISRLDGVRAITYNTSAA